ncbi:MAG: hotdog domain-containing protein [Moraxella sp.]|nr:hotdog domain-containing protein [Moraxella sp.]
MIRLNDCHQMRYIVPANKGVPNLYPESAHFVAMPPVFATGFLVGLMEWACIEHLDVAKHLNDGQGSLGLGMDMVHDAACTEGAVLDVHCVCTDIGKRSVTWQVEVYCQDVLMGHGKHKRVIVDKQTFVNHVNNQTAVIGGKVIKWH